MNLFKIGWFNFSYKPEGKPSDRIRLAQVKAAKDTKLVPWVNAAQSHLHNMGFHRMDVEVSFANIEYSKVGRAYFSDGGDHYIEMSSNLLGGAHGPQFVSTLIHEWAHVWLYNRHGNKKLMKKLTDKLFELRKTDYHDNGALEYALEYDGGDELFTYLVVHYGALDKDLRAFTDSLLK
jgi:hypothetical protein